jgi:hypothetical protein
LRLLNELLKRFLKDAGLGLARPDAALARWEYLLLIVRVQLEVDVERSLLLLVGLLVGKSLLIHGVVHEGLLKKLLLLLLHLLYFFVHFLSLVGLGSLAPLKVARRLPKATLVGDDWPAHVVGRHPSAIVRGHAPLLVLLRDLIGVGPSDREGRLLVVGAWDTPWAICRLESPFLVDEG